MQTIENVHLAHCPVSKMAAISADPDEAYRVLREIREGRTVPNSAAPISQIGPITLALIGVTEPKRRGRPPASTLTEDTAQ
jgi:hypothetical protein